ncbi:MAG: hypothetical protein AAF597_10355 [Bacteroidota bacterium]
MHAVFRSLIRPLLTLLLVGILCTCVRAQIRISRQVIATSVFSATPDGTNQRLKMTATAGEVFVGTKKGDVRATVGFQQPDDDVLTSILTIGDRQITVKAFPNPTIDQLTVDLGEAHNEFTEIQLLDLNGRVIARKTVQLAILHFPEVVKFPGGTYFLRGLDRQHRPLHLGQVIVTPH